MVLPDGSPVRRNAPFESVSTGPCVYMYEYPKRPVSTHALTFAPSTGRTPSETPPEIVIAPVGLVGPFGRAAVEVLDDDGAAGDGVVPPSLPQAGRIAIRKVAQTNGGIRCTRHRLS